MEKKNGLNFKYVIVNCSERVSWVIDFVSIYGICELELLGIWCIRMLWYKIWF